MHLRALRCETRCNVSRGVRANDQPSERRTEPSERRTEELSARAERAAKKIFAILRVRPL